MRRRWPREPHPIDSRRLPRVYPCFVRVVWRAHENIFKYPCFASFSSLYEAFFYQSKLTYGICLLFFLYLPFRNTLIHTVRLFVKCIVGAWDEKIARAATPPVKKKRYTQQCLYSAQKKVVRVQKKTSRAPIKHSHNYASTLSLYSTHCTVYNQYKQERKINAMVLCVVYTRMQTTTTAATKI